MKSSLRWLPLLVLALPFVPQIVLADDALAARMQQHIEADFVKPLAAQERDTSRFSRMRMPPRERRVRMTTTTTTLDASGRAFLTYAIDGKFSGGDWQESQITGCVYSEKGDIFVKIGDGYRPASFMLGTAAEPVAGACVAAPAKS